MSLNRKSRKPIALFWVVREESVFPSAYCAAPVRQQHDSEKGVRLGSLVGDQVKPTARFSILSVVPWKMAFLNVKTVFQYLKDSFTK
jgi:hypothetical protein